MALRVNATAEETFWQIVRCLRVAREEAGLSRHALSSRLRVRHGTIFEWEKGTSRPTLRHLMQWARELGFCLVIVGPDGEERRGSAKRIVGESFEHRELRRLTVPLKTLRDARRLTLVGVSGTIGVDRNSLLRWESVTATPRLMALIVWAQALNCSLALQPRGVRVRPSADPQLALGTQG
jgi:transcriptional regulator with XRE-family HTH domain